MPSVRLREVADDDCRLLWEWANEPSVRAVSFQSSAISWEEHAAWFHARRRDPRCVFYILLDEQGQPVGQVRFELDGSHRTFVDISIARSHRGRGYGSAGLRLACTRLVRVIPGVGVRALIKPSNVISLRTFERAGFIRCTPEEGERRDAVAMRWQLVNADSTR